MALHRTRAADGCRQFRRHWPPALMSFIVRLVMSESRPRGARSSQFELSDRQKRALLFAPLLGGAFIAIAYAALQAAFGSSVADAAWVAIAFVVPTILAAYVVELIVVHPLLGLSSRRSWHPGALPAITAGVITGGAAGAVFSVLGSRGPHMPELSTVGIGCVVGVICALCFWFLASHRQRGEQLNSISFGWRAWWVDCPPGNVTPGCGHGPGGRGGCDLVVGRGPEDICPGGDDHETRERTRKGAWQWHHGRSGLPLASSPKPWFPRCT